MNDEEIAALVVAQSKPKRHLRAKAAAVAVTCLAGGLGLDRLGVDGHLVIRALVLASPVMVAVLLVFLRYSWSQNYTAGPLNVDRIDAEPPSWPDEPDLASRPGQPLAQSTSPVMASPPKVTVTVLPLTSPGQPTEALGYSPSQIRMFLSGGRPEVVAAEYAARHPEITWEDPDGDD